MTWFLGYILIGFIAHFVGAQILRAAPNVSWGWELAAIILWPLAVTLVIINFARNRGRAATQPVKTESEG